MDLVRAADAGNVAQVQALLATGAFDINAQDGDGETALSIAVANKHVNVVTELLKCRGIRINKRNGKNASALDVAVRWAHIDIVRSLLQIEGININERGLYGEPPLVSATQRSDFTTNGKTVDVVQLLLNYPGIDVNVTSNSGSTAISCAAFYDREDVVTLLGSVPGVNVNSLEDNGDTPMHKAARYNKSAAILALLQLPAIDANLQNNSGNTPLCDAADGGSLEALQVLLTFPAIIVNVQNNKGLTALHLATRKGHTEVVQLLLTHENIDLSVLTADGDSALALAEKNMRIEAAMLIRTHDATPEALELAFVAAAEEREKLSLISEVKNGDSVKVRSILQNGRVDINTQDGDGNTALIHAVQGGHCEIVRDLLRVYGINLNLRNAKKASALDQAARYGPANIGRLLVGQPGIHINEKGLFGNIPIVAAAEQGHVDIVRAILNHKDCDVNLGCAMNTCCALYQAAFSNRPAVVSVLLEAPNIDINRTNDAGSTALHIASRYNKLEPVMLLCSDPRADINRQNDFGETALHSAAEGGHVDIVRALLNFNIDVNIPNRQGNTALHIATKYGNLPVAQVLLSYEHIDLAAENHAGQTPVAVARDKKRDDIYALYEAYIRVNGDRNAALLVLINNDAAQVRRREARGNNEEQQVERLAQQAQQVHDEEVRLRQAEEVDRVAREAAAAEGDEAAERVARRQREEEEEAEARRRERQLRLAADAAVAAEKDREERRRKVDAEEIIREQQRQLDDSLRAVFANGAPVALSYELIDSWTRGFSQEIDRGAFGIVYKGVISQNRNNNLPSSASQQQQQQQALYVAVKNINTEAVVVSIKAAGGEISGSQENNNKKSLIQAVAREINILSSFRHPNIIRLVGFCLPTEQRQQRTEADSSGMNQTSLVYEYAGRGGLHKVLTEDKSAEELTWHYRLRVALGVAKGLSYMHNRDAGRPAYHRDIKAANIALTHTFVPKIIDCGLAKYIPEQGVAAGGTALMSITTTTGARFGTVGYMCPKYCKKADMAYDAKCEIFSFGILLLELLTGQIQNRPDLLDDLLDDGEENIVPDRRAGHWPADTVQQLLSLAADCIAAYGKRRASMLTVVQTLAAIEALHPVSSFESSLMKEQEQLKEEVELLRLQRDVEEHRRIREQEKLHVCCVCYDQFPLSQGVLCSGGHCRNGDAEFEQHFFCNSDLSDMVCSQCTDMGNFVKFGCKIVCCMCLAIPVPLGEPQVQTQFDLSVLGSHATADALACFLFANRTAVEELSERKRVAESERVRELHASEMQALRDELIVDKTAKLEASSQRHRLRIINDILTLRCPHCLVAMFDFAGCFAVEHRADDVGAANMRQGCGRHFCGWCLKPFEGSGACHAHVKQCVCAPERSRGSYFGRMSEFNNVHAQTRRDKVLQYLQLNVPDEEEKAKVREVLSRDLIDLNIRL